MEGKLLHLQESIYPTRLVLSGTLTETFHLKYPGIVSAAAVSKHVSSVFGMRCWKLAISLVIHLLNF